MASEKIARKIQPSKQVAANEVLADLLKTQSAQHMDNKSRELLAHAIVDALKHNPEQIRLWLKHSGHLQFSDDLWRILIPKILADRETTLKAAEIFNGEFFVHLFLFPSRIPPERVSFLTALLSNPKLRASVKKALFSSPEVVRKILTMTPKDDDAATQILKSLHLLPSDLAEGNDNVLVVHTKKGLRITPLAEELYRMVERRGLYKSKWLLFKKITSRLSSFFLSNEHNPNTWRILRNTAKNTSSNMLAELLASGTRLLYVGVYTIFYKEAARRIKNGENFLESLPPYLMYHFLIGLSDTGWMHEFFPILVYRYGKEQARAKLISAFVWYERTAKNPTEKIQREIKIVQGIQDALASMNAKERRTFLNQIMREPFGSNIKTLLTYAYGKEMDKNLRQPPTPEERRILDFLFTPPYDYIIKNNEMHVEVLFFGESTKYLRNLLDLFCNKSNVVRIEEKQDGYLVITKLATKHHPVEIFYRLRKVPEKTRAGMTRWFVKFLSHTKAGLIMTRNHSFEGKLLWGAGSSRVLPLFLGPRGVGEGLQNNVFLIVLSEELAKGSAEKKSWREIWKAMSKRMTLTNYFSPNNLAHALIFLTTADHPKATRLHPRPIIAIDGGCGAVFRTREYLFRFSEAIRGFTY